MLFKNQLRMEHTGLDKSHLKIQHFHLTRAFFTVYLFIHIYFATYNKVATVLV